MANHTRGKDTLRLWAAVLVGWTLAGLPVAHAAGEPGTQQTVAGATLPEQEQALRKALSANPNDANAHLKLARVYIDEGKYSNAVTEARAAQKNVLPKDKDDTDALLAQALFLANESDALLTQIKPGDREPHAESEVRLYLGMTHLNPLEIDAAGPLLRDAVRLDPNSWRARIALARWFIIQRQLPDARAQLEAARAIAPTEAGVLRISAELNRAEGNTDAAIADFNQLLKEHTTSIPGLAGRADALLSEGKLPEAMQDVVAALKLNGNSQLVFLGGLILARQGKMTEADQWLAKGAPHFDAMRIGFYLSGVVKFWLGNPEIADYNLTRFLGMEPNESGAVRVQAELALRRKDPESAIKLLQALVDDNPRDNEGVSMLALAYYANHQPDEVLHLYQKITSQPATPVTAPRPVGVLQTMYGDGTGDLVEIEKVYMKNAPDTVLPTVALRQGDVKKAAAMAEALADKNPSDPTIQNLLGSVRLAQKHFSEAEAIFRRVLANDPKFVPAALNLIEVLVATERMDEATAELQHLDQRITNG